MTAISVSSLDNATQELWPERDVQWEFFTNAPFLGEVQKSQITEDTWHHQIPYTTGTGVSNTFAKAQENEGPARYAEFSMSTIEEYATFKITGKALRLIERNSKSEIRKIRQNGDRVLTLLKNKIAASMFGNGGGSVGVIESGSGTSTLTLEVGAQMKVLARDIQVVSDDTDGTPSGATDDGEAVTLTGVDREARQITQAGTWNANGNFATGDNIFIEGCLGGYMTGAFGWIPATAPSSGENFKGVDRSVDPLILAGLRLVATAAEHGTIENALIDCVSRLEDYGSFPKSVYMNPVDVGKFSRELGTRVVHERRPAIDSNGKEIATIGYKGIKIVGAGGGDVVVMGDPWCPRDVALITDPRDWTLYSIGPWVGWLKHDGREIFTVYNADQIEGRFGGYMNLVPTNPIRTARVDISAVT